MIRDTVDYSFLAAIYVLNDEKQLVGVFSPHELLLQNAETPVFKFMIQNPIIAQLETYLGAFLTDFFSFFMIVATAATLFVNGIPLVTGEQAALAIKPFAGELAGVLFAVGILNAGFMGVVIVSLTTAYAFSEFFGLSGSLDRTFTQSRGFYIIFLFQLAIAAIISLLPQVSLFKLAVTAQVINAIMLPLVFKYLIHFTSSKGIMGTFVNSTFKRRFAKTAAVLIAIAAIAAIISIILGG